MSENGMRVVILIAVIAAAGAVFVMRPANQENMTTAEPFAVSLIPTQVFLSASGEELFRHEGFFSREEILAKWNELGIKTGSL